MTSRRGLFCIQRFGACVAMLVVTCNGSDGPPPRAGTGTGDAATTQQAPVADRSVEPIQLAQAGNSDKGIGVGQANDGPKPDRAKPDRPARAGGEAQPRGAMAAMARELFDGVEVNRSRGKLNLTVFPFVSGAGRDARVTRLGVELAKTFERRLVKDPSVRRMVRVFARRRVKKMLEAAGSSEFVSPEVAQRTGKTLGAQLVVWGTLSRRQNGYQVALELRHVVEDELLSAAETMLPPLADYDRWFAEKIRPKKLTLSALLDTAAWELSRRLVDQFKPARPPVKVAVLELEGPEPRQLGPVGRAFADRMENDLVELARGRMELYQRSMLKRILKQRGFEMYGPGFERDVGDLLTTQKVGVFVVGRITAEGSGQGATYAVNVRLVDCKTSRILATARTSMARPVGQTARTRVEFLCFRLLENSRGKITPGTRLRTNDGVKIRVTGGRPSHVWAFLVDGPKRVLCLYPGRWARGPGNPLPAGSNDVPAGRDTFYWLVRGGTGARPTKTLIVAASATGKPALDRLMNQARRGDGERVPVLSLSADDIREAVRACEISRTVEFKVENR